MSDRLWNREDEWTDFALCGGNPDFTLSPKKLGPERTEAVKATCAKCLVRPECIEMNTKPVTAPFSLKVRWPSNSMWVAGEWLPNTYTAGSRRELELVRQELLDSLPFEHAARPLDGL